MVKEINYISIGRVLDNLTDHPMLNEITLEQVIRHTIRFIGLHGYPKLYQDKLAVVPIEEYRGLLPCDLVSVVQVRDCTTGQCMRSMTDNFVPGLRNTASSDDLSPQEVRYREMQAFRERTFKTQGMVIFTSFPEGEVEISYKAIPQDEEGLPLLPDNENFLAALEAYIKKKVFQVKFDMGKIPVSVYQEAKQEYALLAAQLRDEFTVPSVSEFEAYSRAMTHLIPRVRQFDSGFRDLGDREYIRNH